MADFEDARIDARAFSAFVNADADTQVVRRLASPIPTLEYWSNYISGLSKGADGRDGSFIKKAYTTEALMIGDKSNIPANTSVDVTNDPDDNKNGTYAYDGTVFTKAVYDPVAIAVRKSPRFFATLNDLRTSTLANGSYATVINDVLPDKNGDYQKINGAWRRVGYSTDNIVNRMLDVKSGFLDYEIVNYYVSEPIGGTGGNLLPSEQKLKSIIVKVKPNTKYTVEKESSFAFRIMGYTTDPISGQNFNQSIKTEAQTPSFRTDNYGNDLVYWTFTTGSTINYIAVFYRNSGDDKVPAIQVKEGGVFDFTGNLLELPKDVMFNNKRLGNSLQVTEGKNLFDGTYVNGYLEGDGTKGDVRIDSSPKGRTAIIPIKPSTTYTVSKTPSNRLKVGLSPTLPIPDGLRSITLLMGDENPTISQYTFTTRANDKYALIYVAFDAPPPDFMQLEEGSVKTSWVTYGKGLSDAISTPYMPSIVESAGVGNARYIERGLTNVYTDPSKTVIAADDSDALQDLFNKGGVINLDGNKVYAVSKPLLIDLTKVKYLNGNGATLVTVSDGIVLDIFGTKTNDAGPDKATGMNMLSAGEVVRNLKVTSASGLTGQAVRLKNTFMFELDIQCYLMREGVVLEGHNRNIRIRPKIYAMQTNCLRFAENSNLHQGQFYVGDISYANKLIFLDNAEVYNVQFIGGDIETGYVWKNVTTKENIEQHSVIHIRTDTRIVNDISFVGCTIESHNVPWHLVVLDGGASKNIKYLQFSGCFYGNSAADCFVVNGVYNLNIGGIGDTFPDHFIKFNGDADLVNIDVTLSRSGGFLESTGSHTLKNVVAKVNADSLRAHLVDTDCNLNGFKFHNSLSSHFDFRNFTDTKGMINIKAAGRTIDMVSIHNNGIMLPASINDVVKIDGIPSGRVRVQDNDCNKSGAYPADGGNITSTGNYSL